MNAPTEIPRYLVCCTGPEGNSQEPRDTLADARTRLEELRASGRYARGFVLTDEDLELYGFDLTAPPP